MKSGIGKKEESRRVSIIVEHLEPVLGEWIWLEYRHISRMVGRDHLLFTNVLNRKEASKLREIGEVQHDSIVKLKDTIRLPVIVIDPQSPKSLSPKDISDNTSLILGGILGDYPARGRTRQAITSKMRDTQSRNLGPHQFSVDGAAYVAMQVASGKAVTEIPVKVGVEITMSKRHTNVLPFAYPLTKGKPLLAPGLRQYLKRGILKDEKILFKTGRPRSVA